MIRLFGYIWGASIWQNYYQDYTIQSTLQKLFARNLILAVKVAQTYSTQATSWVQLVQPSQSNLANLPTNRLGKGEQSVLAYAQANNLPIVGLDDRQARELAFKLGLHVVGTVGLLLRAKERGLIEAIRPLLTQLQQEGFYISEPLLNYALQIAQEADSL